MILHSNDLAEGTRPVITKYVKFHLLIFGILTAVTVHAQIVSVGVKGGVPALDSTTTRDESKRYVVGPTVELRLPANFAIETDALYQRLGSSTNLLFPITANGTPPAGASPTGSFPSTLRQRGNSWEFPLLVKYYTPYVKHLHPFVSGGFSFRTIGVEGQGINILTFANNATQTVAFERNFRTNLAVGAVAAVGLRYKIGRFSVLPEFRYTRYGSDDRFASKNAATFLIGLSF